MAEITLKKAPPPAWLMRILLIAATTCIILGGQIIVTGWQRGGVITTGNVAIPVYFPGLLLLLLGVRNLWSWRQMKLAIASAAQEKFTDPPA